jgi:hypothetical protein
VGSGELAALRKMGQVAVRPASKLETKSVSRLLRLEFEPEKTALFQILPMKSAAAAKPASSLISLPQTIGPFFSVSPIHFRPPIFSTIQAQGLIK